MKAEITQNHSIESEQTMTISANVGLRFRVGVGTQSFLLFSTACFVPRERAGFHASSKPFAANVLATSKCIDMGL